MLPELITEIPGPESGKLAARLRAHESRNVTYVSKAFPIFWEYAEGANVWDVDGNRYLDFTSGFGVATAGFGNPRLKEVFQNQANRLYHGMGDVHPTELKVRLCELLSRATFERWGAGPGKVLLGSAGFEAVEAALKTAFLATSKRGVICFEGAYHGLGYGAMTVTGREEFRSPFRSQLSDFAVLLPYPDCAHCPWDKGPAAAKQADESSHCDPGCLVLLEKQIREAVSAREIGAILVEPAQGRGGEIFPPKTFLPLLRRLADELGLVLIFDEIYTGFYRTGPLFACESTRTVPDLICLGKALSGAYPISACVGRADLMDAWPESPGEALHTSTFLGNPVGCALAVASVERWLAEPPDRQIQSIADSMRRMLMLLQDDFEIFKHARGSGLMWGVELVDKKGTPAPALTARLIEQGLARGAILLGGGKRNNVLSLAPNLAVQPAEIEWLGKMLKTICSSL